MPQLPEIGSDRRSWGAKLNEYLQVSHNEDGTLKDSVVDEITDDLETDLLALSANVDQIETSVTELEAASINAYTYGLRTTNTAAQNKTAMDLAIAACPDMGIIDIPRGRFLCNNLSPTLKTILFRGQGSGNVLIQYPYGNAAYDVPNLGGTVLLLTSTSGIFLDTGSAARFGSTINLEHISLVGVGDATRTTTAVKMGYGASCSAIETSWNDVNICNVAIGHDADWMYHGSFIGVRYRGCKQAFKGLTCNQNTWTQLWVGSCGDTGVNVFDFNNCGTNVINGVCFQTNEGGTILKLRNASEENVVIGLYSENQAGGSEVSGPNIAYAIDIDAGCDRNLILQVHGTAAGNHDNVRVSSNYNRLVIGKNFTGALTDAGTFNTWELPLTETYMPLTLGGGSIRIGPSDSGYNATRGEMEWDLLRAEGITLTDNTNGIDFANNKWLMYQGGGNNLYIRDKTNSRMHLTLNSGANTEAAIMRVDATFNQMGSFLHFGEGFGVFGAYAAQGAANPDTSGAALATLETEINQLKAVLRSFGFIAT